MDDVTITMAMLGSGPGAWVVTNGALLALNAGLGKYFNELANRLTALLLPIVLVELSILASGATAWSYYVIGFFTGLLAGVGTKTSQAIYDKQVLQVATTEEIKEAKAEATKAETTKTTDIPVKMVHKK